MIVIRDVGGRFEVFSPDRHFEIFEGRLGAQVTALALAAEIQRETGEWPDITAPWPVYLPVRSKGLHAPIRGAGCHAKPAGLATANGNRAATAIVAVRGPLSGLTYIASESGRRDTVAAARPSRPIYSAQGAHMKRRKRVRRCPLLVSLGG